MHLGVKYNFFWPKATYQSQTVSGHIRNT